MSLFFGSGRLLATAVAIMSVTSRSTLLAHEDPAKPGGGHTHTHAHGGGHDHHASGATIKTEVVVGTQHAAGKKTPTVIRLTSANGAPVTLNDLTVAHTEKLHLLIIDESLSDYHHEHPVAGDKPGEYKFDFTPKLGGTYHVWADLLPTATGRQEYSKTQLQVQGKSGERKQTTNEIAETDGYLFAMSTADKKPLRVGEAGTMQIKVTGKDGKPFAGLEPVMGAFAHMVAFPTNLDGVTHVHPSGKEPTTDTERGGPGLTFEVVPEQAGFQKFFLQTRIGGQDKFVAFGVNVEQAAARDPNAKVTYTCPMDPEVKQDTPGKCPKCGMALVAQEAPR